MVYDSLAIDKMYGADSGMHYVIPTRKEKPFVDMGEEVKRFFEQCSCIQSMGDSFLPTIGTVVAFEDLLTIEAGDGHDDGQ